MKTLIRLSILALVLSGCGKPAPSSASYQSTPDSTHSFTLKYAIERDPKGSAAVTCSLTGPFDAPISDSSAWNDSSQHYSCVLANDQGQYWTIVEKDDGSIIATNGKNDVIPLTQK